MNAGKILSLVLFILAVTSVMVNLEYGFGLFFFLSPSNSADPCCFSFPFCFFLVQFSLVSQEWGVSISYSSGAGSTLTRLMIFLLLNSPPRLRANSCVFK